MRVVVRTEARRVRKAFSLAFSAGLHGSVLAWVALGPVMPQGPPPSLYDEIRNRKIIWYSLKERLPEVRPPARKDVGPPRARTNAAQTLVAGARDTPAPPQLIWTPAPAIETRQVLPSPNVVALAAPAKPVRDFTLPPEAPRAERLVPSLPDAPRIAAAQPTAVPLPPMARPQPRAFTPVVEARPAAAPPVLPAAPELTVAMAGKALAPVLPPLSPARRTFVPPVEAAHAPAPLPASLPAAPQVQAVAAVNNPVIPVTVVARAVRPFAAPAAPGAPVAPAAAPLAAPPMLAAPNRVPEASLAIVGLLPARNTEIPAPKASQQAGFSAGPQLRPDGGDSSAEPGQLVVPGLFVRGGAKDEQPTLVARLEPPTSLRNLMGAARSVKVAAPGGGIEPARARRVTRAPDRRLEGRVVYTIAIQMPNVTSFSGSWIVWFAEREPPPGQAPLEVRPPLPLRKVDPKYIAAAAAERVEGKVRLAAVIRKTGHVDTVELLQGLDERLDQSAEEALAKWEFEPASRDGAPVDVDAVFDIPFHLAPRLPKN
jgi:TonB family protein